MRGEFSFARCCCFFGLVARGKRERRRKPIFLFLKNLIRKMFDTSQKKATFSLSLSLSATISSSSHRLEARAPSIKARRAPSLASTSAPGSWRWKLSKLLLPLSSFSFVVVVAAPAAPAAAPAAAVLLLGGGGGE